MISKLFKFKFLLILLISIIISGCGGKFGADARKVSPNPKDRVKKNLEEGKGFRLNMNLHHQMNYGELPWM